MWERVFNEKHITGFLYFKEADLCFDEPTKDDPVRSEQQKLFYPFMAKRLINDLKGLLNKYKIFERYDIIHPWTMSYLSFLYFCKILNKKEYIACLEQYIIVELEKEKADGKDIDT